MNAEQMVKDVQNRATWLHKSLVALRDKNLIPASPQTPVPTWPALLSHVQAVTRSLGGVRDAAGRIQHAPASLAMFPRGLPADPQAMLALPSLFSSLPYFVQIAKAEKDAAALGETPGQDAGLAGEVEAYSQRLEGVRTRVAEYVAATSGGRRGRSGVRTRVGRGRGGGGEEEVKRRGRNRTAMLHAHLKAQLYPLPIRKRKRDRRTASTASTASTGQPAFPSDNPNADEGPSLKRAKHLSPS